MVNANLGKLGRLQRLGSGGRVAASLNNVIIEIGFKTPGESPSITKTNESYSKQFGKSLHRAQTRDNLEPLPPQHPSRGEALATPFAIAVTRDDETLVATAAGMKLVPGKQVGSDWVFQVH